MDSVIRMELRDKRDNWFEVSFPLTDYELLDVVERMGIKPGDSFKTDVIGYDENFICLYGALPPHISMIEFNVLTRKLAELDEREACIFTGLVIKEIENQKGPYELSTLINFAYSTDCCEYVPDITEEEQLGSLYLENGVYPELNELPDSVIPLLSMEAIGRKAQLDEGGVFTHKGYVVQTEELKEVYRDMDMTLKQPEYMILLEISKGHGDGRKSVLLPLPAEPAGMDAALDSIGAKGWGRVKIQCVDCCVPALSRYIGGDDNIAHINRLAQKMQGLNDIQRSKFKVVLYATGSDSVLAATRVADTLDEYLYLPQYASPEDVGRDSLERTMGELVLRYVNLYAYGQALIESQGSVLTDYGLVSRRDGQPVMNASMSASNEMKLV